MNATLLTGLATLVSGVSLAFVWCALCTLVLGEKQHREEATRMLLVTLPVAALALMVIFR